MPPGVPVLFFDIFLLMFEYSCLHFPTTTFPLVLELGVKGVPVNKGILTEILDFLS